MVGYKYHITKLQSGCRGQAAPPFKQLLYAQLTELEKELKNGGYIIFPI